MNVALRPERLDILSICTGGGGLDLGVELAVPGARTVCMVEREAFAVAHLVAAMRAGLMDEAPIWSDARTFDGRAWRGCIDGLIGGIPCQPHSFAGKRLGEEDERDLWSAARRILVQTRSWFVLIENVGGMLSSGGAERVWRDLARFGFAREIGLFTAAEVGDSNERLRLFILGVNDRLAHAQCDGWRQGPELLQPRPEQPIATICGPDLADTGGDGQQWRKKSHLGPIESGQPSPRWSDAERCDRNVVDTVRRGHDGFAQGSLGRAVGGATVEWSERGTLFPPGPHDRESWRVALDRAPELEPAFRRVADGLASRLDLARIERLRMLGNGVVPLQAAYAIRTLATRLAGRGSAGATRLVRMMADA